MAGHNREEGIAFLKAEGYQQPIADTDRFLVSEASSEIVGVVR
jgi:hypothetical protein